MHPPILVALLLLTGGWWLLLLVVLFRSVTCGYLRRLLEFVFEMKIAFNHTYYDVTSVVTLTMF